MKIKIANSIFFIAVMVTGLACTAEPLSMNQIASIVKDICQAPSDSGKYWDVKIEGNGGATVRLKLTDINISSQAKFSKGEWQGVQQVLKEQQANDNADYRSCAKLLGPKLIDKFTPISEKSQSDNSSKSDNSLKKRDNQVPTAYIRDFTFESLGCKRAALNIYCKVRIINNSSAEKPLIIGARGYISKPSYLYDNQGNQYKASGVQFGSKNSSTEAGQTLPSSLPIIAEIRFSDIPIGEDKFSLQIGNTSERWSGSRDRSIVLKNIYLSE